MTITYTSDGRPLVDLGYMVRVVESFILNVKGKKITIAPLRSQDEIRLLGIAFDYACRHFNLDNPFHHQGLPTSTPLNFKWG